MSKVYFENGSTTQIGVAGLVNVIKSKKSNLILGYASDGKVYKYTDYMTEEPKEEDQNITIMAKDSKNLIELSQNQVDILALTNEKRVSVYLRGIFAKMDSCTVLNLDFSENISQILSITGSCFLAMGESTKVYVCRIKEDKSGCEMIQEFNLKPFLEDGEKISRICFGEISDFEKKSLKWLFFAIEKEGKLSNFIGFSLTHSLKIDIFGAKKLTIQKSLGESGFEKIKDMKFIGDLGIGVPHGKIKDDELFYFGFEDGELRMKNIILNYEDRAKIKEGNFGLIFAKQWGFGVMNNEGQCMEFNRVNLIN